MLFNSHREVYLQEEGEVLYYIGAGHINVKQATTALIVGVKQKDGNIRAMVTYHTPSEEPEIKHEKIYSPADFERFLVQIQERIESRPGHILKEIRYRTRTVDDAFVAHLDDKEKDLINQSYMLTLLNGVSRSEAYEKVTATIKDIVKQRI